MKLKLKNIGKIKEAEIDLDNQLTVFFGPNNTGKTFISYAVYGIRTTRPMVDFSDTYIDELYLSAGYNFLELFSNKWLDIDFKKLFSGKFNSTIKGVEKMYSKKLDQVFGIYNNTFDNTKISFSWLENENEFNKFLDIPNFNRKQVLSLNGVVTLTVLENNFTRVSLGENFKTEFDSDEERTLEIRRLQRIIINTKLSLVEPCFFLPAERIGITVFGKDLLLNRFKKTSIPAERNDFVSYSSVINDSIERQFKTNSSLEKNLDDYNVLATLLEDDILKGNLRVNEIGDVFFDDGIVKDVSILNTSSTIKSLSSFVFYLRYYAQKGQTLIIDEPEINLHPENQVKIARVLAKLSRMGVKVIVSTHSDYIIREFNNLIMLGSTQKDKKELLDKYGYFEDEVLSYKNVGACHFNDGLAKQVPVDELGFEAISIDDVISKQNKATNDIQWTLFED
ncbi:MAG: ATP-binding protein [Flavobacterium sp.]|nr:ATP-binding protein [Flavobacterium sp.]